MRTESSPGSLDLLSMSFITTECLFQSLFVGFFTQIKYFPKAVNTTTQQWNMSNLKDWTQKQLCAFYFWRVDSECQTYTVVGEKNEDGRYTTDCEYVIS